MDLVYLFRLLFIRRIWLILSIPLIAGTASFFFTQNLEKKYKSKAQISTGFTTNNRIQITKENFDYWESKSNFENLVEMMKSELIGSMLTYNLLLHDLKEETPFRKQGQGISASEADSITSKLKRNLDTFTLLSSYDEFDKGIIELLNEKKYAFSEWIKEGDLIIERIKDTDFIKIEFSSENPFMSAFVVNKLGEEYIRYNSAIKSTGTEESLNFFANEVEKKKKELDAKTLLLNEFKSSNQVYNYDRESNSKLSQLTEYEIKLQAEDNTIKGLEISLASIEAKMSGFDDNATASNNSKFLDLKEKIAELSSIYAKGGSTDRKLQGKIDSLRRQLQTEMSKLDGGSSKTLTELVNEKEDLKLQLAVANSNAASIRGKINSLKGNISTIGSKEYTIASLERERENAFKDFTTAVEKLNDAKSKSLVASNGVKIMIHGQPNPKPESTKRLAIIALSVLGSLFLCIGAIIMTEYFDYRLKTPDRFTRFVKLNLLGHLNQLGTGIAEGPYPFEKEKLTKEMELMMHLLRKIRFIISNLNMEVILVSSLNLGDGKSFFIKSLARSLSLLNKRILIIDTNFRNNTLTNLIIGNRMLQKPSKLKLLNDAYVKDSTDPTEEYSRSIIFPTSDKNIDIIGSRRGLESPSEMFAGRDFKSLITLLREKYDFILMEGPSLNEYSDTKELTQFADGVISVFSAKTSLKQIDMESIKFLKLLNGKHIGSVLNFVRDEEVKL